MCFLLDGTLSKSGWSSINFFLFFLHLWLFAKKERFKKLLIRLSLISKILEGFPCFGRTFKTILGIGLIIIAAQGIVWSAQGLALGLNMPIILVGIFIVGFGNAIPELYFSIKCSERENNYMVLGNLLGSVITIATLVLGIVALIYPISITGFNSFAIARAFLLFACILFFIFSKTDKKITKKEAWFLIFVYIVFLITETIISF